jgi:CheY-like chemotaxis protein
MFVGPILVVDDDRAICELIKTALTEEGFGVITADNGSQALAQLQEHAVSLIILDLQMPVMDGWEFLQLYQNFEHPLAPIIALSANKRPTRELPSIVGAFLPKPFDLTVLLDLVSSNIKSDT